MTRAGRETRGYRMGTGLQVCKVNPSPDLHTYKLMSYQDLHIWKHFRWRILEQKSLESISIGWHNTTLTAKCGSLLSDSVPYSNKAHVPGVLIFLDSRTVVAQASSPTTQEAEVRGSL